MARPKLPYHKRKDPQVNFRMTPEDREELRNYCKDNKVAVSDVVKVGMSKFYRPAKATVDKELIIQLSKTGNLLNQVARKLNSKSFIERQINKSELKLLNELKDLLDEIRRELL